MRRATDDAYGRLDPAAGAMFRAVLLDAGETESLVLLVIHHLVVDGVSWRILVPDLADACAESRRRRPVHRCERGHVASSEPRHSAGTSSRCGRRRPCRTARRSDAAPSTVARQESGTETLEVSAPVEVTEALLTACGPVQRAGRRRPAAHRAGSGRRPNPGSGCAVDRPRGPRREEQAVPGVDLSRTVGWFTTLYPVRLDVAGVDLVDAFGGGGAAGDALKSVKEQMRRVPDNGIGYGVLRHLDPSPDLRWPPGPAPEIGFNYLGRFSLGEGAGGAGRAHRIRHPRWRGGRDMPVSHAIEIGAVTEDSIDGPILRATWGYTRTWSTPRPSESGDGLGRRPAGAVRACRERSRGWADAERPDAYRPRPGRDRRVRVGVPVEPLSGTLLERPSSSVSLTN